MNDEELLLGLDEAAKAGLETATAEAEDPLSPSPVERVARAVAEVLPSVMPERISTAYWVDAKENHDEGIEVHLYEKKAPMLKNIAFRVGGLLGAWSAGLNVSTEVFRSESGAQVAVGIGAVAPYSDLGDFRLVGTVSLRF